MGSRTTLQNLRNRAKAVNRLIKPLTVQIGQRYSKKYIDLYDADGRMITTIGRGGTSGEKRVMSRNAL